MLLRIFTLFSTAGVALVLLPNVLPWKAVQDDLSADQKKVVDAVSTMFAAARTEDVAKFDSAIAPGFYIFDGGSRFTGEALVELLKKQQAAGKRYEWNITEPDVHISGDTAWIAYVNQGSISDGSGTTIQQWLESAFLQKQGRIWKIVFMHSTRVPTLSQETHGK
jgi:ketosteroid isomerase-like protein